MPAFAPAVAVPGKSQVMNWPTSHLDEAVAVWEKSATQSEQAFATHVSNVRSPGGTVWKGAGADAAYDDAREAQDTVSGHCSVKRECARIARRGAEEIRGAQRTVVNAIRDVEDKGFTVAEDLTVSDASKGGTLAERVVRQTEAKDLTTYLRWHAQGLASTDAKVARELIAEAAGLEGRKLAGGGIQMLGNGGFKLDKVPGDLNLPPGLSEERRKAIKYAEKWADGNNPDYKTYPEDCTNFVSQALRAGGFQDKGDGWDDWHHGDRDDWYYHIDSKNPWNKESETWDNASASHDYFTQHSEIGEIKGVENTPGPSGYDPLAPSKAGLVPGDLIYYKDNAGKIDHVAMYVGNINGIDVVDQHSGKLNFHDDWWPNTDDFWGGSARVEFVHLKYPGE